MISTEKRIYIYKRFTYNEKENCTIWTKIEATKCALPNFSCVYFLNLLLFLFADIMTLCHWFTLYYIHTNENLLSIQNGLKMEKVE